MTHGRNSTAWKYSTSISPPPRPQHQHAQDARRDLGRVSLNAPKVISASLAMTRPRCPSQTRTLFMNKSQFFNRCNNGWTYLTNGSKFLWLFLPNLNTLMPFNGKNRDHKMRSSKLAALRWCQTLWILFWDLFLDRILTWYDWLLDFSKHTNGGDFQNTHTHTWSTKKMEEGQWEVHGVKTSATSSLSGLEQQQKNTSLDL